MNKTDPKTIIENEIYYVQFIDPNTGRIPFCEDEDFEKSIPETGLYLVVKKYLINYDNYENATIIVYQNITSGETFESIDGLIWFSEVDFKLFEFINPYEDRLRSGDIFSVFLVPLTRLFLQVLVAPIPKKLLNLP